MQNVSAVQFSQGFIENTDIPLEVFAFGAFVLLCKRTVQPKSNSRTGLPLVSLPAETEKYIVGQNFTYIFQNLLNVNYFTKIRGIIQNSCYCIFSTDPNKIFHIKDVYM